MLSGTPHYSLCENLELSASPGLQGSEQGDDQPPPNGPSPYNLLSSLPPSRTWYTVLDLKDAFFCLLLATNNQEYYTFEWKDPYLGITGQLTWTHLPQGFKNSPTIFDDALHEDLAMFWQAISR